MNAAPVTAAAMSLAHQSALQMASLGIPVFPLWGTVDGKCTCGDASCRHPGKHPRRLASFKEATTDKAIIDAWFKEASLNFGVRTGIEIEDTGKMLVVIDIDSYKEGGTDEFDTLIAVNGHLPETAEVLTGSGGRHLYFWADAALAFAGKLGRNIDFKVNGYVVGPGSLHASTKRYEWEGSSDPSEGQQIADLPQWIIEKISKSPRDVSVIAPVPTTVLSEDEVFDIRNALLYVKADDYDIWLNILMALKSTGADEQAYAIADAWSRRSAKYDGEELRVKWNHIEPPRLSWRPVSVSQAEMA